MVRHWKQAKTIRNQIEKIISLGSLFGISYLLSFLMYRNKQIDRTGAGHQAIAYVFVLVNGLQGKIICTIEPKKAGRVWCGGAREK